MSEPDPAPGGLPHNAEAERAVLGSILLGDDDSDVLSLVKPILSREDFFSDKHQRIYGGMLDLHARHGKVDLLTLKNELNKGAAEAEAVDALYFSWLLGGVPDYGNAGHYARIVKEKAKLRHLVRLGERIARDSLSGEKPAEEVWAEAADAAARAIASPPGTSWLSPAGVLRAVPLPKARFKSTIAALNTASRGGHPTGALAVVQGPPDSGKTGLGLQDVVKIATEHEVVAVIFTPDQGQEWTAIRTGALVGLDPKKLEERDEAEVAKLDELLRDRRIFLPDDSDERETVEAVIATAERISPELPHVLFVDSLQEARPNGRVGDMGERERVVANVRACQKATKSPRVAWLVLATSQTTKASEARDPKNRPPAVLAGSESGKIGFAPQLTIHLDGDPAEPPGFGRGRVVKNKLGGPKPTFALKLRDPKTTRLEEIDAIEAERQKHDDAARKQEERLASLTGWVRDFLREHPKSSGRQIKKGLRNQRREFSNDDLTDVLVLLKDKGEIESAGGERRSQLWRLREPSFQDDSRRPGRSEVDE